MKPRFETEMGGEQFVNPPVQVKTESGVQTPTVETYEEWLDIVNASLPQPLPEDGR